MRLVPGCNSKPGTTMANVCGAPSLLKVMRTASMIPFTATASATGGSDAGPVSVLRSAQAPGRRQVHVMRLSGSVSQVASPLLPV
jgi:hypothetical protein